MLKPNPLPPAELRLPDPDSPSGDRRGVLIYDGQCNFCRGSVELLRKFDWTGRLAFLSLHDQRVGERWPQLTFEQLMDQVWFVTPGGQAYGGADALRYLSLRMPALWILAPLLNIPGSMPMWRWLYRWVARNRYRIAGRQCENGTCSLHGKR